MIVDKVVHRNIQTLTDTKQRLNMTELDKAVLAIDQAQVIVFSCMGSSAVAGEEGVMRFTRAGKKCLLFRDQSIQLMTTAIVERTRRSDWNQQLRTIDAGHRMPQAGSNQGRQDDLHHVF